MSILPSLIYLPSLVGILLVALATFVSRKARGAGYFAVFSLSMAVWLFPQYIVQATGGRWHALAVIRLTTILSLLVSYFFLLFIYSYTQREKLTLTRHIGLLLPGLSIARLGFSDFVIRRIQASASGIAISAVGPGYYILTTIGLAYVLYGLYLLLKATLKIPAGERSKNYTLVLGLAQAMILSVSSTTIFANSQLAQLLIPLSLFIMALIVSFTIIKHRLFNIQLIIARTIAYLLVLGASAAAFSFVVFGGSALLSNGEHLPLAQQLLYTVAALTLAFMLPVLKKYFDRFSNQLFYRDAYDTQTFLDEFNKVLVSTYELTPLLQTGADTIADNLKSTYVMFGLKETDSAERRITGTVNHPSFSEEVIAYVRSQTINLKTKLIVTDQLDAKHDVLQAQLLQNDVALIVRLVSGSKQEEATGYLVLGPKKSGNAYSSQDLRVIEIIANESVIAIQNSLRTEEIQNFNRTLQAKVEEATRKLRSANEKLKVLDETKDDFISMASHQLRTPLTSIKGYISMVLEEDAGRINPQQEQMLSQAFFSSQRMVFLIADLLNLSRLKTGKFIIEAAPVNLADVVQQEIQQLTETAASRRHKLEYVKPLAFPTLMLDETKIRQVIMNFTDNAIYYTPNGGHIVVRLIDKPQTIELRIEDNGIGVPRNERPHLFTKFYRAGNARKARPDGTGLGLFMAKKIIIAQGGALIFDSTEGKGSTFGFSFSKKHLAKLAEVPVVPVKAVTATAAKPSTTA